MIKSLQIKNFQSHKSTELEFDPGVNIIIGSSDSGKTAIIRALRWAVFNRPQGDGFRSHWGGDTEVVVQFDDCTITRKKDKQEEYLLNDKSFKAFRTDVPQEIIEALRMDSVNLQSQLDAPYLLSETAGAVAAHFNKVARLDKIDKGLYNVQSALRSLGSEVKYKTKDIGDIQDQLKQYENLPKIEAHVEILEDLEKRLQTYYQQKTRLSSLCKKIIDINETLTTDFEIIKVEPLVDSILAKQTKIISLQNVWLELQKLKNQIKKIEKQITKHQKLINTEKTVNYNINLYNIINNKIQAKSLLLRKINTINNIQLQLHKKAQQITAKTEKFEKLFPNQCPLCGTQIK